MFKKEIGEGKAADSFSNVMRKSQLDSLNQLMNRLEEQGQRLAKHKTIENLRDYKKLVRQFIGEALSYGLQLSEKQSHNYHSGMKTHQLVEIVDEKLIELQEEVLNKEGQGIDALRLVGEIKGLLINLYM
ncbi:DUF327 domain-containing protein [Bacillus taeanensis]|uniref:DUF327 domain-containing protein n=2 Tax=Bacillus taeanensis TaxID=273032 RepID=A0A366XSZ3_9BACI|nr:DUF327 domain-containing protein [Bacillus taeanensis]